jgi:hypothetical protein
VTKEAAPILTELDQRAMRDLLYFVENWALALKGRDALGHFVGAELNIDPAVIQSALDSFVNNSGLGPLSRHPKHASGTTATGGVHPSQLAPATAPSTAPAPAGQPTVQTTTTPAPSGTQGNGPTSPAPTSPAPPSPAPALPPNTIQKLLNFLLGP